MKDIVKYLFIGGIAWAGYRYYGLIQAVRKVSFSLTGATWNYLNKSRIQIGFWLSAKNDSEETLYIKDGSQLYIYLNGLKCGNVHVPYQQQVSGMSVGKIYVVADVYYQTAFGEFWNLFLNMATTATVMIAGKMTINSLIVPVPQIQIYEFSLKDAIQDIAEGKKDESGE